MVVDTASGVTNWPAVEAIGTIAGVIVTLFAVVVALWGEEWKRWARRPMLQTIVRDDPACCYKTPVSGGEAYFFRIWIENNGLDPAKDVQVFASKLWKRNGLGAFQTVEQFLPMFLLWTHQQPPSPTLMGLHPHMGHHCDLGRFVNGRKDDPRFTLMVEVAPNTGWHKLEPGTYRLELAVAAANAAPRRCTIEISFAGEWFDDPEQMSRKGVAIKLVT